LPAADVGDVVQATLTEALAADSAPDDEEEIRRWVFGIARHKVIDWYRSRRREVPLDVEAPEEAAAGAPRVGVPAPEATADAANVASLLRWAERELPEGPENARTLQWLLREGEGETLEAIAAEEAVEPPRVRQRVSRLRRHFRARWALQAAALAALVAIAIILAVALRKKTEQVAPRIDPTLQPQLGPLPVPLPDAVPESRPAASAPGPISTASPPPVSTEFGSFGTPPVVHATGPSTPVGKWAPRRPSATTDSIGSSGPRYHVVLTPDVTPTASE
jgi:RNA polymerase sigma factor (sigma-70 family)